MTQTLRREMRQKFDIILEEIFPTCGIKAELLTTAELENNRRKKNSYSERFADAALELRAFNLPTPRIDRTDAEWDELNKKKLDSLIPTDQTQVDEVKHRDEIANLYESEMGYNPLQWWTDKKLMRLLRFLLKQTPENIKTFAAWSKREYSPLSPTQARKNPDLVMECWPQAFEKKTTNEPKGFQAVREFLEMNGVANG